MTVYVDVLIIVNTIIDYFILLSAQKIAKTHCKIQRRILAALFGGVLSMYIFAPNFGVIINAVVWAISGFVIVLAACGKQQIKKFLRLLAAYIFSNGVYGGMVTAFWTLFKPKGMIVYNGVIYYQLSPIVLLIITVLCYAAISLSERFLKQKAPMAQRCEISLFYGEQTFGLLAIIDTGHSLCDPFSEQSVIIADVSGIKDIAQKIPQNKYRLIPYSDISGKGVLNAFVADKAEIIINDKKHILLKPIIALAREGMLPQDFTALVSPQIFNEETECIKV